MSEFPVQPGQLNLRFRFRNSYDDQFAILGIPAEFLRVVRNSAENFTAQNDGFCVIYGWIIVIFEAIIRQTDFGTDSSRLSFVSACEKSTVVAHFCVRSRQHKGGKSQLSR